MSLRTHKDIVILGAGPAGMSAALFLAQQGIPSTILERKTFPRSKTCGDALSGKVFDVLKQIDTNILQEFSRSANAIGCWGIKFIAPNGTEASIPFQQAFNTHPGTLPSGFIMKRVHFDHYLYEKCLQSNLITLKTETEYTEVQRTGIGYQILTSYGEMIDTKLILCADGAQSKFAREQGQIHMEAEHFSGSVRGYFKNVSGFEKGNFIELYFLKGVLPGYFWIFPLPNGEANIGLGLRSDYISKDKVNLKKLLYEIIESHPEIRQRLQGAEMVGTLEGFGIPLGSKVRKISGDHFMLLGDAASLVDPFTGEGIGNAVFSGKIAAKIAQEALSLFKFEASFLNSYDQAIYKQLGDELKLGRKLQNLSVYPWLMNFMIGKARNNTEFKRTLTAMFENVDLRAKFRDPRFYLKLLFNKA